METPNPELTLAEEFVRHTNSHIFLTGKAGTGKTTFLHNIQKQLHKRTVVTAPTGVAAITAGGVTLHSFFQLPFGPFVPDGGGHTGKYRFSKEKKNIIKSLDLLVIDEISMVRADLLDGVDSVLRRYRHNEAPFGGVQLLMIGDLLQLAPVARESEWDLLREHYETPFFFSSIALRKTAMVPIELKHIYRQSDNRFIALLNRIRTNDLDTVTLRQLNTRYIPDFTPREEDGYITLCTHNQKADTINRSKLASLPGKTYRFDTELDGSFPEHAYPTAATLELKQGAQVMFVRNDPSPEKRYFNGKIGKITKISSQAVTVSCPEDDEPIDVGKVVWENFEYTSDPETAEISRKVVGTFKQYPLKCAWAITIHKSQGLTFDKAVIDAQAAFANGQVYVALSRCRTFEGLVLCSQISSSAVKSDRTIHHFLEENRHHAPTRQTLETARIRYQQQLLLECFSFHDLGSLTGRLAYLAGGNADLVRVSGVEDIHECRRKAQMEIVSVGEKFKRQLQGMFTENHRPSDDDAVRERLSKASAYFEEKITSILVPLVDDLRIDTDNKDIRKKIKNTIKRLNEAAAVKLAAVKSCRKGFSPLEYLRSLSMAEIEAGQAKPAPKPKTAAYTEADIAHSELFRELKTWRHRKATDEGVAHFQVLHQKTLVQIAVQLPDSMAALKKVKGIGKRLAERYGNELVALVTDYRREHRIEDVILPEPAPPDPTAENKITPKSKEDTKKTTFNLFKIGRTIPQIAEERGLAVSTIEGHLSFFIEKGELDINNVMTEDRCKAIEQGIAVRKGSPLKILKEDLGDGYSYGEIRFVLSHLKHIENQNNDSGA
jgi:hypothetical protein